MKSEQQIKRRFHQLKNPEQGYENQAHWENRIHQAEALAWVLGISEDKINYQRGTE